MSAGVNVGDVDNPNNPINKLSTWVTSQGFNNVMLLLLVVTMLAGLFGLPLYVLRYVVPEHLKSIQVETAKAVENVAKIGDNRLEQQGNLYERLISEDGERDNEVLVGLKDALNDLRKTFEDRNRVSDQTNTKVMEANDRLLLIMENWRDGKKNSPVVP